MAALVAGSLPPAAEEAFRAASASLFPERKGDLRTECSCPDWANPCKHVAAVYYLVAEELDRDPLVLLRLRAVEREGFVRAATGAEANVAEGGTAEEATATSEGEPLPADPAPFWGSTPNPSAVAVAPAVVAAPLVRGLGEPSFWRGGSDILPFAARVLARAGEEALAALVEPERLQAEEGPAAERPADGKRAGPA